MYALLIKGLVQGFRIEASHGYMGDLEFLTESMADAAPRHSERHRPTRRF